MNKVNMHTFWLQIQSYILMGGCLLGLIKGASASSKQSGYTIDKNESTKEKVISGSECLQQIERFQNLKV